MAYRHHRHHYHRHGGNDSGLGCVFTAILGIIAMPIVGLFMLLGKDEDKKGIGLVLLIVGIILWLIIAAQ